MRTYLTMGIALLAALATPVGAAPHTALICSIAVLQACDEVDGCTRVSHAEANVPRFFRVDLVKHEISGTRPDGSEARSAVPTMIAGDERLTLQGFENGRAWSASIGDDGSLTVAASGVDIAVAGFGACTAP